MNIVIVDDDKVAGRMLADKLSSYDDIAIGGIAINGFDGLRLVQSVQPDVLFLDIELPDISGIEFLERLNMCGNGKQRVVMYTAHDRYMLQAFRNQAFDYLMKPIDDVELRGIIRRLCIDLQQSSGTSGVAIDDDIATTASLTSVDDGIKRRSDGKFLFYTNATDFRIVDIRDVGIFAYDHDTRAWELFIAGQTDPIHLKRNVSSDMIVTLSDNLVRVSQKHIINLNYLMEVIDNTCRFFPPFDTFDDVKVGRFFRKKLISKFGGL